MENLSAFAVKQMNLSKMQGPAVKIDATSMKKKKKKHKQYNKKKSRKQVQYFENESHASNERNEKKRKLILNFKKYDSKKLEIDEHEKKYIYEDSVLEAEDTFCWLIYPFSKLEFKLKYWEKSPLIINRNNKTFYKDLFTLNEFYEILLKNDIYFTHHLDVTSYVNEVRKTHNPEGRAYPAVVRDFYNVGCSLRLLRPQAFSKKVWKLLSILQEFFNSSTGANIYLTPPDSQGFAPHYDDIEAFVLQLEGSKRWKIYSPSDDKKILPLYSSQDISRNKLGNPILNVVLNPGDLLYFPKGFIHEACTFDLDGQYSLHMTLSCSQLHTWKNLFEKILPAALEIATLEDAEFRESLPWDYSNHAGIVNTKDSQKRSAMFSKVEKLMSKLITFAPIDAAVDQMAKEHIIDCLPPLLKQDEWNHCILGQSELKSNKSDKFNLDLNSQVKLIRKGVISVNNSLFYHGADPQYIILENPMVTAIEYLLDSYPKFVPVKSLPLISNDDKVTLSYELWCRGILLVENII